MSRLIFYIALSLIISMAGAWLISLPGTLTIDVGGYRMQPGLGASIFALIALIIISIAIWAIIRRIIETPKKLAKLNAQRRKNIGTQALSDGFIALQAGDNINALKLAKEAKSRLEKNGAAKLLEAKANLALGDLGQAAEHYKALISDEKTAQAALNGLFEQAKIQKRDDVAITFAKKAFSIEPKSTWAKTAVFDDLTKNENFEDALKLITLKKFPNKLERDKIQRKRTILNTAIAQKNEETNPDKAFLHANAALKLSPNFVPAALIAAHILINKNQIRKSSSLLKRVFNATKHPHIGTLYINAQSGAAAIEKLKRAKELLSEKPKEQTAAILLAQSAANAYEWTYAKDILADFIDNNPTQAICVLMAKIEEGLNETGKSRNWLSRAITAPRDATWVANSIHSDEWEPISPLNGKLDAFKWQIPQSNITIINEEIKETTKDEKPLTLAP